MANQGSPINKALYPAGLWDNFMLSHVGTLIGALELSGVDPQGYSAADLASATTVMRNLVQSQHPATSLTQYYWHYEGPRSGSRKGPIRVAACFLSAVRSF